MDRKNHIFASPHSHVLTRPKHLFPSANIYVPQDLFVEIFFACCVPPFRGFWTVAEIKFMTDPCHFFPIRLYWKIEWFFFLCEREFDSDLTFEGNLQLLNLSGVEKPLLLFFKGLNFYKCILHPLPKNICFVLIIASDKQRI